MDRRGAPSGNELSVSDGIRIAADLDSLERCEIEDLRRRNFDAMRAAVRRAPAVAAWFAGAHEMAAVDDLPKLPLLTPADLANGCPPEHDDFLLGPDEPGLVLRSSGTAGKQKTVYHSWQYNDRVRRLGARGVRAAAKRPPGRVANCMFAGELTGAFGFVQDIAQLLPARVFPLGSRVPVADVADVIAGHGVDTLVAGPAYGTELIAGHAARMAALRTFFYLGEPMGAERRRTVAAAAADLTVRSLAYSTSEIGPIGYQCPHQHDTTHHVHEDVVVVEVVDGESGTPVPDGTPGEVVVTPLTDTGKALFRYRIGDRRLLHTRPCPCGSAARLLTLLGRTAQSITVDVTTVSSDQLMAGLAGLGVSDPADCQFQVLWDFPTYRVRLLLSPSAPAAITPEAVGASLRSSQFNRILTNPRCTEFTVERVAVGDFTRTERGKVPVLYQRLS